MADLKTKVKAINKIHQNEKYDEKITEEVHFIQSMWNTRRMN